MRTRSARRRTIRPGCSAPERRGVITLLTILGLPALLVMLCFTAEIAHLWSARVQLENGLEAAALAAAQHWGSTSGGDTLAARQFGVAYAGANLVSNRLPSSTYPTIMLDANYAAGSINGNATLPGNLVFGAVTSTPVMNASDLVTFNANKVPSCGYVKNYGKVGLSFTFETGPQGSTFGDQNVFAINFINDPTTPPDPALSIASIEIQLQADSSDNGVFDLDVTPSPTEDLGNPPAREGWGPSVSTSPPPQFSPTITGPVSFTPNGSTPTQSATLLVEFTPGEFTEGKSFVFGADTDGVANGLSDVGDTTDNGGDFKDAGGAFAVKITFNNGGSVTISGLDTEVQGTAGKTYTPNGLVKDLLVFIPSTGEFGVHAQATVSIKSLCDQLFGIPLGPYAVTADTTAVTGCGANNKPRLIHVDEFTPAGI